MCLWNFSMKQFQLWIQIQAQISVKVLFRNIRLIVQLALHTAETLYLSPPLTTTHFLQMTVLNLFILPVLTRTQEVDSTN